MMQVKYCTLHRLAGLPENYYFFKVTSGKPSILICDQAADAFFVYR